MSAAIRWLSDHAEAFGLALTVVMLGAIIYVATRKDPINGDDDGAQGP